VVAWTFSEQAVRRALHGIPLPDSSATWFPLRTATAAMGVLGVKLPPEARLDFSTRQTIEAFALQLALVLEKEHFIFAARPRPRSRPIRKSCTVRTLLDSVSHELKTPLAVIHAALEGMSEVGDPYLTEIETASRRLQRVVDDLLRMTRLESEVLKPHFDWCDLRDLISAAEQAARREPQEAAWFQVKTPANLPPVKVDHTLLAQAMANILHNAAILPATDADRGRPATIEDAMLFIAIRDHGPGLPVGEEDRVFEILPGERNEDGRNRTRLGHCPRLASPGRRSLRGIIPTVARSLSLR